jgi:hypothetical protein
MLPSFEFFNWLVMVQADGADEIVFDVSAPKTRKFNLESVHRRFASILQPGPALAGLPSRIGNDESRFSATPSDLLLWIKSGRTFTRLQTVKPPVQCEFTITIRANSDNLTGPKGRDSNRDAWLKFADEIGAIIIDDYSVMPIHLHDRFALYAGARMNFGVCNGPLHVCSLSTYPVMMFVQSVSAYDSQIRWGLQHGENYPWMLPHQRIIWEEDKLENIRRAFSRNKMIWR